MKRNLLSKNLYLAINTITLLMLLMIIPGNAKAAVTVTYDSEVPFTSIECGPDEIVMGARYDDNSTGLYFLTCGKMTADLSPVTKDAPVSYQDKAGFSCPNNNFFVGQDFVSSPTTNYCARMFVNGDTSNPISWSGINNVAWNPDPLITQDQITCALNNTAIGYYGNTNSPNGNLWNNTIGLRCTGTYMYTSILAPTPVTFTNTGYVAAGNTVSMSWTTSNADRVYISGSLGAPGYLNRPNTPPNLTISYSNSGHYSYNLWAYNGLTKSNTYLTTSFDVGPGNFDMSAPGVPNPDCAGNDVNGIAHVRWQNSSGATSYKLQRSINGGTYQDVPGAGNIIGSAYDDVTIVYPNTYTYRVYAQNNFGTTLSNGNSATFTADLCKKPSVTLRADPHHVLRGEISKLSWNSTNTSTSGSTLVIDNGIGSVAKPGGNMDVRPLVPTTYKITADNESNFYGPATANALVAVGNTVSNGDVYSGNIFSDQNGKIQFDTNRSVLIAKNSINVVNPDSPEKAYWTISPYDSVMWQTAKTKMEKNVADLKKNAVVLGGPDYLFTGTWYLNSDALTPNTNLNPEKHVDGKVWYIKGNLTLSNTTFCGIGTIIADKIITINSDLVYGSCGTGYAKNSLGIVSTGNSGMNIANTVESLIGAYFTEGKINFQ